MLNLNDLANEVATELGESVTETKHRMKAVRDAIQKRVDGLEGMTKMERIFAIVSVIDRLFGIDE